MADAALVAIPLGAVSIAVMIRIAMAIERRKEEKAKKNFLRMPEPREKLPLSEQAEQKIAEELMRRFDETGVIHHAWPEKKDNDSTSGKI